MKVLYLETSNQILMKTTGNAVSQSVNTALLTIDDSIGLSFSELEDPLLCKADGNWHEYTFTVKNEETSHFLWIGRILLLMMVGNLASLNHQKPLMQRTGASDCGR